MRYEMKNVELLVPNARNARTHSAAQIQKIANSIKEYGFMNPVILDKNDEIIAGHGRLAAAKLLGLSEVPTLLADHLTPAQVRAYRLADNKLALDAGWDEDLLRLELKELQELGDFDMGLTGFDDDELKELLEIQAEGQTDEDEVPPVPVDPVSQQGDIWLLGEHRVMCGDSTDPGQVETLMESELADLLLTDPPYNVAYEGKTKDAMKIKNDQMGDESFKKFLFLAFNAANNSLKEGGVFYIWHADSEGYNFRGACNDAGWKVRQCLIWLKQSMVLGRQDYQWKHEPCLYGWKDGAAHYWGTDRKQTTVLEFNRPARNDIHPTMKPVELMEYQIKNSSKKDEVVLDLFGGSGSTMIACEKTKRKARLMELDPVYVDVIVRRWELFTGKSAKLSETGKTFKQVEKARKN